MSHLKQIELKEKDKLERELLVQKGKDKIIFDKEIERTKVKSSINYAS